MPTPRSTGVRRTTVGLGDARVAGLYEPTADWPTLGANYDRVAAALGGTLQLECSGRVSNERAFDYRSLLRSARRLPGGIVGLPVVDVFAAVGLHATADVIVFSDREGGELTVPIRDLMCHGVIVLGRVDLPLATAGGLTLCLDVKRWTDDVARFVPASAHAMSFAEFLAWSR